MLPWGMLDGNLTTVCNSVFLKPRACVLGKEPRLDFVAMVNSGTPHLSMRRSFLARGPSPGLSRGLSSVDLADLLQHSRLISGVVNLTPICPLSPTSLHDTSRSNRSALSIRGHTSPEHFLLCGPPISCHLSLPLGWPTLPKVVLGICDQASTLFPRLPASRNPFSILCTTIHLTFERG